jgi:ATP-dependent Clp protease adapter protein ClpS
MKQECRRRCCECIPWLTVHFIGICVAWSVAGGAGRLPWLTVHFNGCGICVA